MLEKLNSIFVNIFNFILIPVSNFSDEVKILYISILSGIIFLSIVILDENIEVEIAFN